MSNDKQTKVEKVEAKVAKPATAVEAKPKLITISSICFNAAKSKLEFKNGSEGLDAHIAKTLAAANQKVNIRGKPITPDNIRSQRAAWMADVKKQRKGRWANVQIEQNETGVLKLFNKKEA